MEFDALSKGQILGPYEWVDPPEYPIGSHEGIVTLVVIGPDKMLTEIGTAFIIQSRQDKAIAMTAAHNIHDGVRLAQRPYRRHHPSTPSEFLPEQTISAGSSAMRAIVISGDRVEVCLIGDVIWDQDADLAVLTILTPDPMDRDLFRSHFTIAASDPLPGDMVCVLGFCGYQSTMYVIQDHQGTLEHQRVMRIGTVVDIHSGGLRRNSSPYVEATMPTYAGMSGAPCFLVGPTQTAEVFGILSSSGGSSSSAQDDIDDPIKRDHRVRGSSMFAVIPREVIKLDGGSQVVRLAIHISGTARNPDVDSARLEVDWQWIETGPIA